MFAVLWSSPTTTNSGRDERLMRTVTAGSPRWSSRCPGRSVTPRYIPVADHHRLALAAADAERGKPVGSVRAAHFVEQGDQDPAAAGSDRMAQSDRAPMRIEPVLLDAELFDHRQRLCRECLVELQQVNVREHEPGPLQRLARRWGGADSHDLGLDPSRRIAFDRAEG